jgi:hypothetical protein
MNSWKNSAMMKIMLTAAELAWARTVDFFKENL